MWKCKSKNVKSESERVNESAKKSKKDKCRNLVQKMSKALLLFLVEGFP